MERYTRQMNLPNFGIEAQKKLTNAKVLVIGIGGLGCPVLQTLAGAGIGTLGLIDGDTVSITNLHRQLLFKESDIGQLKVEAAKKNLQQINSDIKIVTYPLYFKIENGLELISTYDIIVDGTDDLSARYLINDFCALLNKPLVYAALYQYEGQIAVFHHGKNPTNLRHIFPQINFPETVVNCTEAGILGVLTTIMGNMQAQETIKSIIGIGEVCNRKIGLYDMRNLSLNFFTINTNTTIFIPKNIEEISKYHKEYTTTCKNQNNEDEIDLNNLKNKEFIWIDVRNHNEFPRLKNKNLLEIPLHELENNWNQLEMLSPILFICKSGIRSKKAMELAKEKFPEKEIRYCKIDEK